MRLRAPGRHLLSFLGLIFFGLPPASTQTRAQIPTAPAFEVSTIKPSSGSPGTLSGISDSHGTLQARYVTLKRCLMGAYSLGPNQILGGPNWLDGDHFDIEAKSDTPVSEDSIMMIMFRAVLADRFSLATHRETRVLPAYVLEVAKGGPTLQNAVAGQVTTQSSTGNGDISVDATRRTVGDYATLLARRLDLPVVDKTGLAGTYNFKLHWTSDRERLSPNPPADAVSIFTAVREQLGLTLRQTKAPVEVIVIDHAQRPSAN